MKVALKHRDKQQEFLEAKFSSVTYKTFNQLTPKQRIKHKNYLLKYLERLIKHPKTQKVRVIENKFPKEEVNQPDFFCVKEPISWATSTKIKNEIEIITNQINLLENEQID